jgi:hypothetical protein
MLPAECDVGATVTYLKIEFASVQDPYHFSVESLAILNLSGGDAAGLQFDYTARRLDVRSVHSNYVLSPLTWNPTG